MKPCSKCGKEFEALIANCNGVDKPHVTECPECRQKQRDEEIKQRALKELAEAKEEVRESWYDECNIPAMFVDKTFDNFNRKLQSKAFDIMKGYSGRSIVLLSPNVYGVGKTHLVCALANHILSTKETARLRRDSYSVIRCKCPVYFTTETQLLSQIRNTYNRRPEQEGEIEEDIYRQLDRYPLLIIDDIGKVHPRDYSFLQGVYYRIIDWRYVNEEPIILTTNLNYDELETHIGGACADRLHEMAGDNFVKMGGKSYRLGEK